MVEHKLVSVPYAECRRKYFEKLKQHEENRLKYWAKFASKYALTEKTEWALYDAGDNISFLEDAIKALEQPEIVRCGECKHYMFDVDSYFQCDFGGGLNHPEPLDFCSYGERKDD